MLDIYYASTGFDVVSTTSYTCTEAIETKATTTAVTKITPMTGETPTSVSFQSTSHRKCGRKPAVLTVDNCH